jgi:hypothetical protein
MIATLNDVLICRVELVMPAIMPEYAGATRPVIIRINVGRASPCPKPITKRMTARGSAVGLTVIGVRTTSQARSTNPNTSSPIPTGFT